MDDIKEHPYYKAMKDVLDQYEPEELTKLTDTEQGRDQLFHKFWVNYVENQAKENK